MVKYSTVVPIYNEEDVIREFYKRLKKAMDSTGDDYEFIFINDGSTDSTSNLIKEICNKDKKVKSLEFSRNFGHQIAISAGLDHAQGDAIVIIDGDLQDPPEVIPEMIEKWKEGFQVVHGKRTSRKGETLFKKLSAYLFYRVLKALTDINFQLDSGDFKLIDKQVCENIKKLSEKKRFVRGLISWLGFKQTYVEYVREGRFAGESKYPLKRLLQFAVDGIASLSYEPLRVAFGLGLLLSFISFMYLICVIYQKIFTSSTIIGWTLVIAVNLFFFGIVLIILGIIGEYIARIYEETKDRPLYIVKDKLGF